MKVDLRRAARARPCLVRVPHVCDGGGETTVLAHYRLAGYAGVGIKPDDILGAWCCGPCHAAIDGHTKTLHTTAELRRWHAEGCMRTIAALRREGLL